MVDRVDLADWPLLSKLTRWGVNAHMGTLFGLANQLVLAALATGLIRVIVRGYRMWWRRRPTRADRRAPLGTPPARGAWRGIPSWGPGHRRRHPDRGRLGTAPVRHPPGRLPGRRHRRRRRPPRPYARHRLMIAASGLRWIFTVVLALTTLHGVLRSVPPGVAPADRVDHALHAVMGLSMIAMVWPRDMDVPAFPQVVVFAAGALWFVCSAPFRAEGGFRPGKLFGALLHAVMSAAMASRW